MGNVNWQQYIEMLYNQASSYLSQMFTKRNEIHDRERRNQNELDIPKYRTATSQRTFKYRGTKFGMH